MKVMLRFILSLLGVGLWSFIPCQAKERYQDASLPVEERVKDLMSKMTLEEKVAQMCQYVGIGHAVKAKKMPDASRTMGGIDAIAADNLGLKGLPKRLALGEVGSCLHVTSAEEANQIQEYARLSRLKIPVLIGIDAIHGNGLHKGVTIYPTSIGMASTFNPDLLRKTGEQTAREMRAAGMHWTFNPNIEITRDPRWGRTGETFGEDTYLVTRMGVALIKGLQGENGVEKDRVAACAKHMLGGGEPAGGLNAAPADMSEQKMREVYLPPFEAAVREAHVYSIMPAHNEVNGIPCHANAELMLGVARKEFGFKGFFISDWLDIERLKDMHAYLPSQNEAFCTAVEAGVDMHMHGPNFMEAIVDSVKKGRISEARIDAAIRKILELKFLLGLFDNPFVDVEKGKKDIFSKEHRDTALEAARQSIVLLKNDNLLPVKPGVFKRILVVGPNADSQGMLGDWAFEQPRENFVTVVDGIRKVFPDATVETACLEPQIVAMKEKDIADAEKKAKEADLNIVVVGENSQRYFRTPTCGENRDRDNLELPGLQQELLEKVHASGKPTILVLINGRPLGLPWADRKVPAIIEAWEPGSFGGLAIAEIIAGQVNPSGRLPISIPRHVGQIPTIYNHKKSQYSRHFTMSPVTGALYPFGYGLSYTTWKYGDVKLSKSTIKPDETIIASCDVTNTGEREGTETVQLYINDEYGSVTRPVKELRGFERVTLKPGETRAVTFDISPKVLQCYTARKTWEVEPGTFKIMIGSSSRDKDLKQAQLTVK